MRISMPRGDIRYIRFLVNDPNGTAAELDFSEIYFTIKKSTKDRLYQFQKKLSDGGITKLGLGDYQVKIEPADTAKMFYGTYVGDVQLQYEGSDAPDLMLKESFLFDFVLTDEVTYEENE